MEVLSPMPAPIGPSPPHVETIGFFLLRRLKEVGLAHIFGVAGDFNMEFLEQLEQTPDVDWVGCCNELNAAYAADGYARTHGLAALVTTYGVGELSALCGVAGAFAEHIPIISISGAPPITQIRRHALLHHTAGDGDYRNMMACGREFSVAQARLDPQNAAAEIDRCLKACILEKRPVYLQLPSDLAAIEIETPEAPLAINWVSDAASLKSFAEAAKGAIDGANRIAILVDADVARFGQSAAVISLANHLGCPVAVMGTAKGVIDESASSFLGVYAGAGSRPAVREAIESADCLLELGVRFIDSTTASFSQDIAPDRSIRIGAWHGCVNGTDFLGLSLRDMLSNLTDTSTSRPRKTDPVEAPPPVTDRPPQMTQAWFWQRIGHFLEEGDVVVAENGTSLSGIAGTHLPAMAQVICQALWGAIGYSLPATFGSLMAAPDRRHVLFIGDGSFQLTVQELSSILRHDLKPIIFLINNDGYTIERLILGENSSYNDIQPWKYTDLCHVFANGAAFNSKRVTSPDELDAALEEAGRANRCTFIEVIMGRMDAPDALRKLGPIYARQDYGQSWTDGSA